MVLVGISDLDEESASKYPGIHEYGQCQSRAFIKGIFAFFAGGAAGLTASFAIRQRYAKFPPTYNVAFVAGGAIVTSYVVASIASKRCQKLWVNTAQQHDSKESRDSKPRSADGMTRANRTDPEISLEEVVMKTTKYGDRMR